jgi:hypothetical protein
VPSLRKEAAVKWEFALLVTAIIAELSIILLMIRGSVFRSFPVFFSYICWSLLNDPLIYFVQVSYPAFFFRAYLIQLLVDSLMIFALLAEITWNVLSPIHKSLPKYSWGVIVVLLAIGSAILWPVAGLVAPEHLTAAGRNLFLLHQTPAILRAVFYLALITFSQLLSIGWRDREFQIASGLGFYSIISLTVTILHAHQQSGTPQYHWLDLADSFSYLTVLVYWVFAFATKPVERREFTPQMQNVLLAVAGAAKSTRAGLTGSNSNKNKFGK